MDGIIFPEKPLLIMYNESTDELGISAEGFELVAIATFLVFNRLEVDVEDYEEYSGGYSSMPDGAVLGKFGYIPNGTIMIQKDYEWVVIGQY